MKLKINTFLFSALLVATSLFSCKKEINLAPENATYDQVFWANGNNVQKATSGAYVLLRDALKQEGGFFIFGDIAADNFSLGGDLWNYATFVKNRGFNFNYAPYLEGTVQNWSRFYKVINQCNLIIANVPNIPDAKFTDGAAEKKLRIGEAKFLRAYTYFYMQRVWGDVILVKEPFADPLNIPPLPRSAENLTLAFCLQDLASATSLLKYDNSKNKANKGGLLGLTAHIYAWQHNYQKAQLYCDSVINSSKYQLEDVADYKKIWAGNSKESIFELNMLYNATSATESSADFFNIFLADPFVRDRGNGNIYFGGDTFFDIFQEPEARVDSAFKLASDGSTHLLSKYVNVNYYDPNNENAYVVSNNLVLFRLADFYLLRAEAKAKNGNDAGSLIDLNIIRRRAKLADYAGSGSDLFSEILDERRRELIGEGCNAFDIIRMGQLQVLFPTAYSNLRITQKGYFWPLNMRVLGKQNNLLTQNEWWRGNF